MVWSNWRGAVAVMAAWVGLAWSQAPAPTSSPGRGERIMTVHENGKSIRCRIVSTWRTPEGSQAYQLQALESGETITIVEDGPAASMEEQTLAGKVKALPMRIFHWGRNRATPPGVPASPEIIESPEPIAAVEPMAATEPIVLDAPKMEASPTCAPGCPVVTTKTIGKEQTVWWEEKNGKRVSPMIVTEGKNPFEQPTIHTMPETVALPIIAERQNTPAPAAGVPIVVDAPTPAPASEANVVTTTPASKSTLIGGPVVSCTTSTDPTGMREAPPTIRPIVKAAPAAPVATTPIAKDNPEPKSTPVPKPPGATTLNIAASQANPNSVSAPPAAIRADNTLPPYTKPGPTLLPIVPQPMQTGLAALAQPDTTANPYPTTAAAAAANTTAAASAPAAPARTTLADRIHNLLHPKRETSVVTTPETKQVAAGAPRPDAQATAAPPSTPVRTLPFSTAADQSARAGAVPPPMPNTQAMANANRSVPPPANMSAQNAGDPAMGQATPTLPAPQSTPSVVKKDWRTMWGQPKDAKAQLPGQSLVDQASAKPTVPGLPSLNNPPAVGKLPPTAALDKQAADILLSPEKFDPAGSRLIPKGINMSSFRGDPASLMTKTSPAVAAQAAAPSGTDQSPLLQTTAMQAPPLPGKDGRVPLGVQSIVAANGPASAAYIPAPPVNVADPYRVPAPPAPRLPEPALPSAYANAFTPAAPPPSNAMTANAFSNMNVQPNATQVARNIPQAPMSRADDVPSAYQPNPMAQGYPVAPGYPPNPNVMMAQGMPSPYYHGAQSQMPPPLPAPAPPVAEAKSVQQYAAPQFPNAATSEPRQPIQPTQYTESAKPQAATNVTRPAAPGATNAELAQMLKVLRESPYPAQREWASNTLGTYDWRAHPEVVQLLLQAAQQDPAAIVRASCVYSLAHMNAASEPVISTLQMLRNDGDPRVRQEVEQALVRLKN